MSSELVINVTSLETRVGLIENGTLAELYIERASDRGIVGNIYKGKVQRVLPGMQAAFVDIGLPRAAFLYVDDVYNNDKEFESMLRNFKENNGNPELEQFESGRHYGQVQPLIEDVLTNGKELMVQVIKDPIGSKGARISSHISLPGRYLVYLPTLGNIGISRRIIDEDERERLKNIVEKINSSDHGFIIRTASEGATEEELATDMDFLFKLWENIQKKMKHAPVSSLFYEDLDLSLRAIRDLYSKNVRKVVADSQKTYESIVYFIETYMPQLKYTVDLYEGKIPVFDSFGIEIDVSRALDKNISMKSGGYITIEETEALVAIDVNTGRYVGKGNHADTILKTNLEAIKEIAYQTRLRNLGGIIIIDFIDMERKSDREMVINSLHESFKNDRAKTNIVDISELGLVQMTRKRVRENLSGYMCSPCPYCDGRGHVRSITSMSYEILRAIRKEAATTLESRIVVTANPEVVSFLYDEEGEAIEEIEKEIEKKIDIKSDSSFHLEKYGLYFH